MLENFMKFALFAKLIFFGIYYMTLFIGICNVGSVLVLQECSRRQYLSKV